MMPGLSGQELLKGVRAVAPEAEVVLMTAYGTVEAAVAAMRDGAYDFLTKPLKRHAVLKSVAQALEKRRLVQENKQLRARLSGAPSPIVGQSPALRATLDVIRQAAPSSATVLLLGQSGTGKELFARALHEHSLRAQGPFVPINCAAIPESILESELFGYEKGAFTGAAQRKEGRIERAQGGTLFLDEVGELSPAVQVKLLRFLQEGEIERLGGSAAIKVDCRVVAATNRELSAQVKEGRFREDLFYRLNVIQVVLPPLRDRVEDVPLLADHFVARYAAKNAKPVRALTAGARACHLVARRPPGRPPASGAPARRRRNHGMRLAVSLIRGDRSSEVLVGRHAARRRPRRVLVRAHREHGRGKRHRAQARAAA